MSQQPPPNQPGAMPPLGQPGSVPPPSGPPMSRVDLGAGRGPWQQGPAGMPVQSAPAPAAPPAKGGFKRGFGAGLGWALGAGVVALVVGVITTGIFSFGLLAVSGSASEASTAVTVWGDETDSNVILAIPITGVILGDSAGQSPLFGQGVYGYEIARQLDSLEADDVDAVVLEFNTPGGTIYGAKAIADAVQRYQERTEKPVVAFVRGTSASGGMYAMAGADKIIVDHGTMVGSIGVIMGPFERYRGVTSVDGGLLAGGVTTSGGIDNYYITRGKGKDLGNPFRDMTPEERASLDTWMDSEYKNFVTHVADNRGIPAQTIIDKYGAFMFGPQQAIENKLADVELGQEEAYREVAKMAEVDPDETRVVMEQSDIGVLGALLGGGMSSPVQPGTAEAGATELEQGRAAIRASSVCTGQASVLAVNGDLAQYCTG